MYINLAGDRFDYASGPFCVSIKKGDVNVSFDIEIIDDKILENDETFTLTIDSSGFPNGFKLKWPYTSTVTILEDECK